MKKNKAKLPETKLEKKLNEIKLKQEQAVTGYHTAFADDLKLLHELQVHQLEIEMQNEELRLKNFIRQEEFDVKYNDLFEFAPYGYFTLNLDGSIQQVNLTGATLLGINRSALIHKSYIKSILPDDRDIFRFCWSNLVETKDRQVCEVRISRPNGQRLYVRLALSIAENKNELQILLAATDITMEKQVEDTQSFLLGYSWAKSGKDFFEIMAEYLSKTLRMDYVCIDKLHKKGLEAQTVAIYFDGHFENNVRYTLKDTPCGKVVGQKVCCFPNEVRKLFPEDEVLQEMVAESYAGITLWGSEGKPIGLIAVIGRKPLTDIRLVEMVLKLVSISAASELEHRQAEEVLSVSETHLRTLYKTMNEGLVNHDIVYENGIAVDYIITDFNPAFERITGLDQKSTIGRKASELYKTGNPPYIDIYAKVAAGGPSQCFETYFPPMEKYFSISVFSPGNGKFATVFTDVTERKLAEEALRLKDEQRNAIIQTAMDGFWIVDRMGRILEVNETYCRISGYTSEELLNMNISDLELIETADETATHIQKILKDGEDRFESRHRRKDGSILYVESSVQYRNQEGGQFVAFLHDITLRRRSEENLRQSEERYKSLFQGNYSVMLLIDPETGEIRHANAAASRFYGWPHSELCKKNISEINTLSTQEVIEEMRKAKEEKRNQFFFKHRLANGEIHDVEIFSGPITYSDSTMIYSIVHDITERIQAEKALKESEMKFRKYIDFSPHGIFVANELGEYVEINSAACKTTGFSKKELLSMKLIELVPEESLEGAGNHFKRVVNEGFASEELPFKRKDGSIGYWIVDAVKISDKLFMGFVVETTERKLAEETLIEKERLLRESQSCAHIGSYSADLIGKTWKASEEIYRVFGIDETYPHTLDGWIQSIHPDFRAQLANDLLKAEAGKSHFEHEYKIIRISDGNERWVHGIGEFEFDDQFNAIRLIGTIQDITVRKRAELALKQLNEELEDKVNERTSDLLLSHIAIQDAEEKYRTVADFTYDWETWVSPEGKFIYISPSCKRITGYPIEEFMNDPELYFKISHPDDRQMVKDHFNASLKGVVFDHNVDFRITTSDGEKRWIGHSCHPVYSADGQFLGQRGSNRDITEQKLAEIVLIDSKKHLRELTHRMDVIAEEERIHIAREIHDELGHLLTVLKYDMEELINKSVLTKESVKSELDSMISMIESIIDSVRKIATELRPGILDHLGLFPAIEWQIKQFQKRDKICFHYDPGEMEISFDKNETTIIYRIMQEILTNVVRHSKANKVSISLDKRDDFFIMSVNDNGVGFELNDSLYTGSLGLMGMKERAMSIGGEIRISSAAGKGTTVTFSLLKNQNKS